MLLRITFAEVIQGAFETAEGKAPPASEFSSLTSVFPSFQPGKLHRGFNPPGGPDFLAEGRALRADLSADIRASLSRHSACPSSARDALAALLADVDGQFEAALSRRDWWGRWGTHYLRSLASAHALQQCNNFKDAGVQCYGGRLFQAVRDDADGTFLKLPPPEPSLAGHGSGGHGAGGHVTGGGGGGLDMSTFHDRNRPCFHGDSLVRMAHGAPSKRLRDLRRGDRCVAGGRGASAEGREEAEGRKHAEGPAAPVAVVRCVVRTRLAPGSRALLVALPGGLRATPWHPVRPAGASAWAFPASLGEPRHEVPLPGSRETRGKQLAADW